LNNTIVPVYISNYTQYYINSVSISIPIGAYSEDGLATAVVTALNAGGFPTSICSYSPTTNRFTVQINPPSPPANPNVFPYNNPAFVVDATNNMLNFTVNSVLQTVYVPVGTYSINALVQAMATALTGTFNGVACIASSSMSRSTLPDASGAYVLELMQGTLLPVPGLSTVINLYGGASSKGGLLYFLGNKEGGGTQGRTTFQYGTIIPWKLLLPQFGVSTGFTRDTSTLFAYMGFTAANGYAATMVTSIFNNVTGVTTRAPVVSPDFVRHRATVSGLCTLSASAPIIWKPQHTGRVSLYAQGSSYQYICRLVDDCFATIMAALNQQLRVFTGNPAAAFTTATPRLQFQNNIYTLVLDPAYSTTPVTEIFSLAQNLGCSRFLNFPILKSVDVDARRPQDCITDPALTIPTVTLDTSGGVPTDGLCYVSQEFDNTANWAPYVGLTIVSSAIPANAELSGVTLVNTTSAATPTIGDASTTILFDMDLSGDSAHSYLGGISFSPTIMRFNSLSGSSLGTISFQVFLRRRDGTLDVWDVPRYGCIDLKLLFQYGN
jgi:hypothetical protein